MATILSINSFGSGGFGKSNPETKRKTVSANRPVLNMRGCGRKSETQPSRKKTEMNSRNAFVVLFLITALSGIFYLYQVNDLASKGYDLKKLQVQMADLKSNNEKNRIKEAELMSMYNMEKATRDLNFVSQQNISYLEINDSVAMK